MSTELTPNVVQSGIFWDSIATDTRSFYLFLSNKELNWNWTHQNCFCQQSVLTLIWIVAFRWVSRAVWKKILGNLFPFPYLYHSKPLQPLSLGYLPGDVTLVSEGWACFHSYIVSLSKFIQSHFGCGITFPCHCILLQPAAPLRPNFSFIESNQFHLTWCN